MTGHPRADGPITGSSVHAAPSQLHVSPNIVWSSDVVPPKRIVGTPALLLALLPEPVADPLPEPVADPLPAPVADPLPEPVADPLPEPVADPVLDEPGAPKPGDRSIAVRAPHSRVVTHAPRPRISASRAIPPTNDGCT
jgi:hypothetical protein